LIVLKKILPVLFSFILFSCIKPEEPTADIIPKDSMAQILIDIHLAEAKVAVKNPSPDTGQMMYEYYKRGIYKNYNISPQRFNSSLEFYTRNVTELNQIYEVVVDSLSLREGRRQLD
jgi:hypothetical protein